MTCDADPAIELEFERMRLKQRRYAERNSSNQEVTLAIKMLIGVGTSMSSAYGREKSRRATSGVAKACRLAQGTKRAQLLERVGRTPGNSLAFIVACYGRADHEVESVRGRNVLSVSPVVGCCVGPCARTSNTDSA